MIRVIMHGCNGKMGQVITGLCKEDPDVEIVAGIDVVDNRENGYPVFTDINACDVKADVILQQPLRLISCLIMQLISRFQLYFVRPDFPRSSSTRYLFALRR